MTGLWQHVIVALLVPVALLFAVWRLSPAALRLQALEKMARLLGADSPAGSGLQRLADRLREKYIQSGCANCGGGIKPRLK